ncbi:MAG: YbaK/EbsC family protein [Aerococcus sp.]|nr:YbaK/EbsC family protein [Aerococcus sp.]
MSVLPDPSVAYDLLKEYDIDYERLDHEPITSVQNIDIVLPGQQVKNLFLKGKKGKHFYLVLLHDEKRADIHQLAEALGDKRLSFASDHYLEELLHVEPGVVTPFGVFYDIEHKVEVIVDAEVDRSSTATVGFHPFTNTTTLNIKYTDFDRLMRALDHPIRIIEA